MKTRLKQQANAANSQTSVKPHAPLRSYILTCLVTCLASLVPLGIGASSAFGFTSPAGGLTVSSVVPLGGFSEAQNTECETPPSEGKYLCDQFVVTVTDAGAAASAGPIVLKDELPAGMTVVNAKLLLMPAAPAQLT